jgi:hypothetical protein
MDVFIRILLGPFLCHFRHHLADWSRPGSLLPYYLFSLTFFSAYTSFPLLISHRRTAARCGFGVATVFISD